MSANGEVKLEGKLKAERLKSYFIGRTTNSVETSHKGINKRK